VVARATTCGRNKQLPQQAGRGPAPFVGFKNQGGLGQGTSTGKRRRPRKNTPEAEAAELSGKTEERPDTRHRSVQIIKIAHKGCAISGYRDNHTKLIPLLPITRFLKSVRAQFPKL